MDQSAGAVIPKEEQKAKPKPISLGHLRTESDSVQTPILHRGVFASSDGSFGEVQSLPLTEANIKKTLDIERPDLERKDSKRRVSFQNSEDFQTSVKDKNRP